MEMWRNGIAYASKAFRPKGRGGSNPFISSLIERAFIMRIVLAAVIFSLLPLSVRAAEPLPPPPNTVMAYEQLADWAQRFDDLYDAIPRAMYPKMTTDAEIQQWVQEIVPFFSYERVTDPKQETGEPFGARYPTSIEYTYYTTGRDHNHLLGTTNCLSGEITMNARMTNSTSPFFERDDTLVVLVHELAHAQGICWGDDRLDSEVSAHLVTLEVMAAMLNRGNTFVLGPLVAELRDMSLAAAQYAATRDGKLDQYFAFEAELLDDEFERAFEDKARRFWESDPAQLTRILEAYNYGPLNELRIAFGQSCVYRDLYWSKETQDIEADLVHTDAPCVNGVQLPINWSVFEQPLIVDDLYYFFEHAEGFVSTLNEV